jgi:hypothetical protein
VSPYSKLFKNQKGGGPGRSTNCDREIPERCKLQNFRGRKEKIPWGRLRVYIIQQKQGQSKAEDIVGCRKTLHSTSKVVHLNERKFPHERKFCAIAALAANVKSEAGTQK